MPGAGRRPQRNWCLFCGLTEDECRKLQEESESFNDEMIKFIDNMFGRENMISEGSTISENDTICINIKYHKNRGSL